MVAILATKCLSHRLHACGAVPGRPGGGRRGAKKLSKEDALKAAEAKQQRLAEATAQHDKELIAAEAWRAALGRASGDKVLDDPKLLRRSLKREEQDKARKGKRWEERVTAQQEQQQARQDKRKNNLAARANTKLDKKKAKRDKKLLRAGFEGRKSGFINAAKPNDHSQAFSGAKHVEGIAATRSDAATWTKFSQRQDGDRGYGVAPAFINSASEGSQYWYSRSYRALKQRAADPAQMVREFQHVAALDDSIPHRVDVAKSRVASGRNRYCNVLPYDHNRVVLEGSQHYINASLIEVQPPHLPQPCRYIATQGPMPGTAADFWRMVFDLKIPAIVMVTNVNECGVNKCAQYYPAQANNIVRLPGLELQSSDTVQLHPASSAVGFRSHFVPSLVVVVVVLVLVQTRASRQPIVVHCSAGIGRTGTFCAIDILLQRFDSWQSLNEGQGPDRAEVEATLNLPQLVHDLRAQRMGMVQTLDQYVFVYKTLLDDLAARIGR
eukprot:gene3503-3772_t